MPPTPPFRIIIDTNIWISFLIGKTFTELKPLIINRTVEIVWCTQLRDEIQQVTQRPKLQKYFPAAKVQELLEFLDVISLSVEIQSIVTICRDEKDNFLLALAQDSDANYLITGDADLLVLEKFGTTEILQYQEFLDRIR